jgi:hypothetical protein
MAKLLIVVPDADMRSRHTGLWEQAKKHGIKQEELKKGDIVAFLNSAKDRIATLAVTGEKDSLGVVSYYVSPHGRVEPYAIQYIPECMGASGGLDMTKATRKALEELIPQKRKRKES